MVGAPKGKTEQNWAAIHVWATSHRHSTLLAFLCSVETEILGLAEGLNRRDFDNLYAGLPLQIAPNGKHVYVNERSSTI